MFSNPRSYLQNLGSKNLTNPFDDPYLLCLYIHCVNQKFVHENMLYMTILINLMNEVIQHSLILSYFLYYLQFSHKNLLYHLYIALLLGKILLHYYDKMQFLHVLKYLLKNQQYNIEVKD